MAGRATAGKAGPARRRAPAVGRPKRPVTIDIHSHVDVPEVLEFNRLNAEKGNRAGAVSWVSKESAAVQQKLNSGVRHKLTDPEARLRDMDRTGVDIQIISMNLATAAYEADGETGLKVARACNDGLAAFAQHPSGRFIAIGAAPLQDARLAAQEMKRARGMGVRGVLIPSNICGAELGDPKYRKFWAAAARLDMPVFVHPRGFTHPDRLQRFFMWNSVGQPLEEALSMCSLIYEGVMDAHPGLKVVIAHGGGFLPFYTGRVDRAYEVRPEASRTIRRKPSAYLRNFHYDNVVFDPAMHEYLVARVGADRVMLGTDYPRGAHETDPVRFVMRSRRLSDAAKRKIVGGNAARLFGITV